MEYEELVKRINELARKNKECGLTADEEAERKSLREDYMSRIRQSFRSQMDNTYILDPKTGKKTKVKPKQ